MGEETAKWASPQGFKNAVGVRGENRIRETFETWLGREKAAFTMASQRGQDIIAPQSEFTDLGQCFGCHPLIEITGSLCWRRRCNPSDLLNQAQALPQTAVGIAVGEIEAAEKVAEGGAAEAAGLLEALHDIPARLRKVCKQPRSLGRLAILQPGLSGFQGLDKCLICWPVADQFDAQALNDEGAPVPFVEAEKSL